MFNKHIGLFDRFAPLFARIFIGGMFVTAGISKVTSFSGTVGFIDSVGLPAASILAILAILVEIGGGISLLLGYKIRHGATLLALFTLVVSLIFHANFADQIQMTLFTKNFAIIGGLLYMAVYGAGAFSHEYSQKHKQSVMTP